MLRTESEVRRRDALGRATHVRFDGRIVGHDVVRFTAAEDFRLGPEHADRPCNLCAFRPICPDARKVL